MQKAQYEKMISELKTIFEPQIYDQDENGVRLVFAIDTSEDDETGEGPGHDQLADINAILRRYGQLADWKGCGNGDYEDAECDIEFDEAMQINFIERGTGYPQAGDVLLDHEAQKAYRVLPGAGNISTGNAMRGDANECPLNVEEEDYEEYSDDADAWEI